MVAEETYEEREARYKKEFIAKEMKKRFTDDKSWEALNFTDEELDRYEIDPASRWNMKKMDDVTCPPEIQSYHLKLELVPDARWGESLTDYLGGEEDKRRFLKLAKAQQGITRDIVVPGDMNLHALHYAIQQAFGWQNSHLHRYCLPEECFNRLTAGRVGGYMNLCGVLFRCDNEDSDDLYWDDDYEPEMSVKTWIKRKYSRPFRHYAVTDTRYECRRHKLWFRKKHPEITEDMRVSILNSERFGDMFCDDLMEGLTIDDIFGWSGCSDWSNEEAREWMEYIITESFFQDDRFIEEMTAEYEVEHGLYRAGIADKDKAPMDQEIEEEFNSLVDNLKTVRKSRNVIEQEIWKDKQLGGDSGHKYIEEQVGYSAEEALVSYGRHVKYLEGCCEPLFEEYVVHPLPFTDELLYQYDFGDNWWVRITLVGIGDYDVEQAKCIASDGLNLVDDCGGINGFYGFLQSVYGDDPEDKESMKQWARGLGWTGRKKKPENML